MTGGQIAFISAVGIVGLFIIVVYPNLPTGKPYVDPCAKIGASYRGHGLCAKPDGSIWQAPQQ